MGYSFLEKTKVASVKARLAFISRMERVRSELFLKILVVFQVFFPTKDLQLRGMGLFLQGLGH